MIIAKFTDSSYVYNSDQSVDKVGFRIDICPAEFCKPPCDLGHYRQDDPDAAARLIQTST